MTLMRPQARRLFPCLRRRPKLPSALRFRRSSMPPPNAPPTRPRRKTITLRLTRPVWPSIASRARIGFPAPSRSITRQAENDRRQRNAGPVTVSRNSDRHSGRAPSSQSGEGVAEDGGWGAESRAIGPQVPGHVGASRLARSSGPTPSGASRHLPPQGWGRRAAEAPTPRRRPLHDMAGLADAC